MADGNDPAGFWDDPRVQHVVKCVLLTYPKLSKGAKFDKLLQTEANSDVLEQFFARDGPKCLLVPENLKLAASSDGGLPSRMPKTKCLAISKKTGELTAANIRASTFVTELGGMLSFEHLELVAKNVLLPVLSNQTNQANWGELSHVSL